MRRIFRIVGWMGAVILGLLLLVILGFYLGRGLILERTLRYANKNLPGEIRTGQVNLIPLMDFPNAVLQLKNVSLYEKPVVQGELYQEPILLLSDLFVSLDLVELYRGEVNVSRLRLKQGFMRLELGADSVLNLERALGIRLGEKQDEAAGDRGTMNIDLQSIQLKDFLAIYEDTFSDNAARLGIRFLESRFLSLPGRIEAELELEMDVDSVTYQKYRVKNREAIELSGQLMLDPETSRMEIRPSFLTLSGLELSTEGTVNLGREPAVDISFRATNRGIELLNEVFFRVLDMDEIRQTGNGTITLEGTVSGPLDRGIPQVRIRGEAEDLAFRIRSIGEEVTGISFMLSAESGQRSDLGEAQITLDNVRAQIPEGWIRGRLKAANLVAPVVDLDLEGKTDLAVLDRILQNDRITGLTGMVEVEADLRGEVDKGNKRWDEEGSLHARLENVGFSTEDFSVGELSGFLSHERNVSRLSGLRGRFNGDFLQADARVDHALHYLLGYERDLQAWLRVASDSLHPSTLTGDTALAGLLGSPVRDLRLEATASIAGEELDRFLGEDSIPRARIALHDLRAELPAYSRLTDFSGILSLGPDSLRIDSLRGTVGSSSFRFSGHASPYFEYVRGDSGAFLGLDFRLRSDLLKAGELLTYKERFLLPDEYRTETVKELILNGNVQLNSIKDSSTPELSLNIEELEWGLRYYPLRFENFTLALQRTGNDLAIPHLQGRVGESDLRLSARIENFTDSSIQEMDGMFMLESQLLDFNKLLNYSIPGERADSTVPDPGSPKEAPGLHEIEFPDFNFEVDIGELRYGGNSLFGMEGTLRSSEEKIFYLDSLHISGKSGGTIGINGQFSVANPYFYNFSTELNLNQVNISDLNFEMRSGEEVYTLEQNFAGRVSADGLAEIIFTPDLALDVSSTTAMFNVQVTDGALINFTPLQAAGKYLDNKDLNHVRFSTLRNSFTLMDSRVIIPLMIVESTIGQLLIEGEQGLDNTYLYLLRIPTWLVRDAAWNRLLGSRESSQEDEIQKMQMGNFMRMTVWGDSATTEVKLGDKRERYRP